ncbi:MAG: polyprenyl synthetase family protein [Longimicrobiales bacterium]
MRAPLERVGDEIRRIVLSDFDHIEEVNEHLLFMRGKLFRPTLLLLSSRAGGHEDEDALTLAAVVELVHLATLVHDDAVDHSALRRGLPTVNALWTHQVAVIMGDYLYSRGVSELARIGNLEALAVLANAANEMSVGEMRQLTSYDALDFTEDDYYRLIAAKTASLMSAACEMGAISGAPEYREALATYGHNLGMAFQIADDLLDYTGSEAVTGKPTGHDLRERKVTLPLVSALERVSDIEDREIRSFFTRIDPTDEEIARIVQIVVERGGLEYASDVAARYADRAREALEALPDGPAVTSLFDAVSYAVDRVR